MNKYRIQILAEDCKRRKYPNTHHNQRRGQFKDNPMSLCRHRNCLILFRTFLTVMIN